MRISNNIFDQGIFWLVMLLAVLPFGQILNVRLPGVTLNAFDLIWVSMLGILWSKILFYKKAKEPFLVFMFFCVCFIVSDAFLCFVRWIFVREGFPKIPSKYPLIRQNPSLVDVL